MGFFVKKNLSVLFVFCMSFLSAEKNEDILKEQWEIFANHHPSLESFSSKEVASLANQWGKRISQRLGISETVREVDALSVERLTVLLQEGRPKVFMRHGEQQKTEKVSHLLANLQKIEMMRLPDNFENSLTQASLAEWLEGMIIWNYISQKTACSVILESSQNKRAELLSCLLAPVLKTQVNFKESLNCVNYPSARSLSDTEILELLPDGTLPWEQQKVDTIIAPGTYEHISQEMNKILNFKESAQVIFIAITHTQQINAVAVALGLPPTRLGNFGFMVVTDKNKEVFPDGFYRPKK